MTAKWNSETTIKFIKAYKYHECLWDFMSPDYNNKQMRDEAYSMIVEVMDLPDCGVHEVKNKIKNLRSTYSQEFKKVEDSKKTAVRAHQIYQSNIKWLKELEPVMEGCKKNFLQRGAFQPSPVRKKRKTGDFNTLSENVATIDDSFDIFGSSVAMQLKRLTEERALLAQCRIQSVLTEYGIEDLKDKREVFGAI